jgi:hypothetical protein
MSWGTLQESVSNVRSVPDVEQKEQFAIDAVVHYQELVDLYASTQALKTSALASLRNITNTNPKWSGLPDAQESLSDIEGSLVNIARLKAEGKRAADDAAAAVAGTGAGSVPATIKIKSDARKPEARVRASERARASADAESRDREAAEKAAEARVRIQNEARAARLERLNAARRATEEEAAAAAAAESERRKADEEAGAAAAAAAEAERRKAEEEAGAAAAAAAEAERRKAEEEAAASAAAAAEAERRKAEEEAAAAAAAAEAERRKAEEEAAAAAEGRKADEEAAAAGAAAEKPEAGAEAAEAAEATRRSASAREAVQILKGMSTIRAILDEKRGRRNLVFPDVPTTPVGSPAPLSAALPPAELTKEEQEANGYFNQVQRIIGSLRTGEGYYLEAINRERDLEILNGIKTKYPETAADIDPLIGEIELIASLIAPPSGGGDSKSSTIRAICSFTNRITPESPEPQLSAQLSKIVNARHHVIEDLVFPTQDADGNYTKFENSDGSTHQINVTFPGKKFSFRFRLYQKGSSRKHRRNGKE